MYTLKTGKKKVPEGKRHANMYVNSHQNDNNYFRAKGINREPALGKWVKDHMIF